MFAEEKRVLSNTYYLFTKEEMNFQEENKVFFKRTMIYQRKKVFTKEGKHFLEGRKSIFKGRRV